MLAKVGMDRRHRFPEVEAPPWERWSLKDGQTKGECGMQMRNIITAICCIGVSAAVAASASSISKADAQFMVTAAKADMTEAHAGQMAQQQGRRTDLKAFAKTLVQDHTESYEQLTELAAKTGVSIPKGINAARDRNIERLARLEMARFDRQFVSDVIEAHRHAIAIFKLEAKRGQNSDVKAYAAKMIPVLEKDLHLVEECGKPPRRS
jgi:putative membrane protein